MKIRMVRKRDGREVPFDKHKIAAAVARAQSAVGDEDAQAAADVADIVELALARRYLGERTLVPAAGEALPGIEEIQDLVEQALIELGHAAVAKAYILYRDKRARVRAALDARSEAAGVDGESRESAPRPSVARVRVQVAGGLEAWRKSRIVAALMDEADLQRSVAESIAARVEERVFSLGVKRLSTALIRELVDNELVEMGLSQALRKQRPVGIPRHDLRALVDEGPGPERGRDESLGQRSVSARIAGEVLRRFALEDVLSDASAQLHLEGDIHVEDLEELHHPLTSSVPCDLLLRGEPVARSAFEMLDDLGEMARATAYGIVVEDAGMLVTALGRGQRSVGLPAFLAALSGVARASGRRIDLAFAGGSHSPWLARLVEECAALADEGRVRSAPRLFLDAADVVRLASPDEGDLERAVEALLCTGRIVPTWSSPRARFAGPGLVRGMRERGALHCGAAVAINLPRAARRSGPWREDALLENLARVLEGALDALADVRAQQRDSARGERSLEIRGRVAYAVVPVGLREALRWLGDGEIRVEQGARVVAFLDEAASRFAHARGLSVALAPWFGERAAARFAELDAGLFQVAQPLLFDERPLSGERAQRGEPYGSGFELRPIDRGPASSTPVEAPPEAGLIGALECGAIHPASILRGSGGRTALERLTRLQIALSQRPGNGLRALHALPPAASTTALLAPEDGDEPTFELTPSASARTSLYPDTEPAGTVASLRRVRSDETQR